MNKWKYLKQNKWTKPSYIALVECLFLFYLFFSADLSSWIFYTRTHTRFLIFLKVELIFLKASFLNAQYKIILLKLIFFIFNSFLWKQKQKKIQYFRNRFNQTIIIQLQIHFISLLKYLLGWWYGYCEIFISLHFLLWIVHGSYFMKKLCNQLLKVT